MKTINLVTVLSFTLPLLSFAGGTDISGGGESVISENKIALRDLQDKTTCLWKTGDELIQMTPHWATIIESIKSQHIGFGKLIDYDIKKNLLFCTTNSHLVQIPTSDDGALTIYESQANRQIAIRLRNEIYLDMSQFSQMDEINKAYLLLHETLHSFIPMNAEYRNNKLRSFVKAVRLNELHPMPKASFVLQIQQAELIDAERFGTHYDQRHRLEVHNRAMNGFTIGDLVSLGWNNLHYSCASLVDTKISVQELYNSGVCDLEALYEASGRSIDKVVKFGFGKKEVVLAAFVYEKSSHARELNTKLSLIELKETGLNAVDLRGVWWREWETTYHAYSFKELRDVGFSLPELKEIAISETDNGFRPNLAKAVSILREAGFTVQDLKPHFGLLDLVNGGFGGCELKTEFSKRDLRRARISRRLIREMRQCD